MQKFFFPLFPKDIAAHLFNIGSHISGEITSFYDDIFYDDIILLPSDVVIRLQVVAGQRLCTCRPVGKPKKNLESMSHQSVLCL